jgi:hypothetical protein
MMAGWPNEISGDLKKSMQAKLDANGLAVITFSPDHANQRWEVTYIGVTTHQNANATLIPYAVPALNTVSLSTMSAGNQRAQATWSGNNDAFRGLIDVGPCDFLSILFYPPTGQSGTPLSGIIASAVVTGTKYIKKGNR